LNALMLRNSGRFLASSVMSLFLSWTDVGADKILLQRNRVLRRTDADLARRAVKAPQFNSFR
jgi:hypothetical protein